MKSSIDRLTCFYDRILQLYPASFRDEYAEEMRTVFQMQLNKQPVDFWLFVRIAWTELLPLPRLLFTAYWRERRKNPMKTGLERWFVQPEGSWKEMILAGLPFVMFGLPGVFIQFPVIMNLPLTIRYMIITLMMLTLIGAGIIGLILKLPRWSLIYAGAFLSFCTLGGLAVIANFGNLPINWGAYQTTAAFLLLHLVVLLLLVASIIRISGKISLVAEFHRQITTAPSLISFMMYGGTLIVLLAIFDDVSEAHWYLIAAAAAMLLGGWGYLRASRVRVQLLWLVIGNTVATALGLTANLLLLNYISPTVSVAGLEIKRVVIFVALTWLTSMAMILLPLVVFRGRVEPVTV